jgi:2-C-methyl-D-erythritol 2,4-cyclodiphosphate synthase
MLGGVRLPFDKGLAGHSDGDALVHALVDALFGAFALGDIGRHFPDDDPEFEGMSGTDLLALARVRLEKVGRIENVDATVIAEAPRLAPHIGSMREAISEGLGVSLDRVSVKAKSAEGLGPVGEGRAIEVHAVALVDQ